MCIGFVEDVARDEVGKRIVGKNPVRLKGSSLFERDAYMNCDVCPENAEW